MNLSEPPESMYFYKANSINTKWKKIIFEQEINIK